MPAVKTKRSKSRIIFSNNQLQQLETAFKHAKYPDISIIEELGGKMGVPMDKIATWFQNRRAKFKRDAKTDHKLWMREQVFQKVDMPNSSAKLDHVISPMVSKNERQPSSNVHHLPETTHQPFRPAISPYCQIPVTRSGQSLMDSISHVPYFPPIVTQEYQQSRILPTTTTNCNRLTPMYQTGTHSYSPEASVFESLPPYGDATPRPNAIRQPLASLMTAPSNFLSDNSYYQHTQSNGYTWAPSPTSYKPTLPLPGYSAPPIMSTSGSSSGVQPFPAQGSLAQY